MSTNRLNLLSFSCAIQQFLIGYLFYTWQCIYVSPNIPIHPTPFSPLDVHPFVLYLCVSISTLQKGSSVEGNGTPLQYSCLENPMEGRAWQAAVHGVAKSQTRLSDFTFRFHFHALEKEIATHSSILAWRIQGRRTLVGNCLWGRTESATTETIQHYTNA